MPAVIAKPCLARHCLNLNWHRECSEVRGRFAKAASVITSSMPKNASTTKRQDSIARFRAPGWITCELCERPASRPPRRLRLTLVRHSDDDAIDDPAALRENAHSAMLVLLCSDCCALIVGAISEDEWRRRTNDSLARTALAHLPPPSAPGPAAIASNKGSSA